MDRNLIDYLHELHHGRQSTHLSSKTVIYCTNLFVKIRLFTRYAGGGGETSTKIICQSFGDNLRLDAGFMQNMYVLFVM